MDIFDTIFASMNWFSWIRSWRGKRNHYTLQYDEDIFFYLKRKGIKVSNVTLINGAVMFDVPDNQMERVRKILSGDENT